MSGKDVESHPSCVTKSELAVQRAYTDWACIQGREVDDSDVFHYNSGFTHQLFRIKINSIQLKETVEENKKTNDQVLQDRQYQVRLNNIRQVFCRGIWHCIARCLSYFGFVSVQWQSPSLSVLTYHICPNLPVSCSNHLPLPFPVALLVCFNSADLV